ncbi:MAG: hypothetical protein ACK4S8_15450, partial [Alishewanella aestuarii]
YIFVDYEVQTGGAQTLTGEVSIVRMDGEWQGDVHFTNTGGIISGQSEDELRRRYGQSMTIVLVGTPAEEEARKAIHESTEAITQQIEGEWVGRSICHIPEGSMAAS